jgi:hypothetical protein
MWELVGGEMIAMQDLRLPVVDVEIRGKSSGAGRSKLVESPE